MGMLMLLLTACGDPYLSALKPKGIVAKEQLGLMKISLGVMIFVFVVVMAIYVYVLVRYRKKEGDNSIPKQVEGNHILEIIWTVIPILLLLVIAIPTVYYTFKHSTDYRNDKDALHVKVTGHQYWWQFEYKDLDINTAEDLIVPVGKRVVFELTTADVNHSFWVPSLAGKIDTNAGMNNTMYLIANEPGTYLGKCAELCGASHSLMEFKVIAKPQAEYDAWVSKMKAPSAVSATASTGQQLFKDNCMSCHAVTPNGSSLGPNLNNFAERTKIAGVLDHTSENLKKWIQDPNSEKPGSKMPQIPLSEQNVNEIVKYLETLK